MALTHPNIQHTIHFRFSTPITHPTFCKKCFTLSGLLNTVSLRAATAEDEARKWFEGFCIGERKERKSRATVMRLKDEKDSVVLYYEDEVERREKALEAERRKVGELENDLETLADLKEYEKSEMNGLLDMHQERVLDAERELQLLRNALEDEETLKQAAESKLEEKDKVLYEERRKSKGLEDVVRVLEAQLEIQKERGVKLEEERKKVLGVEKQLQVVTGLLDDEKLWRTAAEGKAEDLGKENVRIVGGLRALEAVNAELEKKVGVLIYEKEDAEDDVRMWMERYDALWRARTEEARKFEVQEGRLREEVGRLEGRVREFEAYFAEVEEAKEECEEEMSGEEARLRGEVERLEEEVEGLREENGGLRRELQDLQEERDVQLQEQADKEWNEKWEKDRQAERVAEGDERDAVNFTQLPRILFARIMRHSPPTPDAIVKEFKTHRGDLLLLTAHNALRRGSVEEIMKLDPATGKKKAAANEAYYGHVQKYADAFDEAVELVRGRAGRMGFGSAFESVCEELEKLRQVSWGEWVAALRMSKYLAPIESWRPDRLNFINKEQWILLWLGQDDFTEPQPLPSAFLRTLTGHHPIFLTIAPYPEITTETTKSFFPECDEDDIEMAITEPADAAFDISDDSDDDDDAAELIEDYPQRLPWMDRVEEVVHGW